MAIKRCLFAASLFAAMVIATARITTTGMDPRITINININPGDVIDLRSIIYEFAKKEGLSVEDYGSTKDGEPSFWLELADDGSTTIDILNIREPNHIVVWFYQLEPEPRFRDMALGFQYMLNKRWKDLSCRSEELKTARAPVFQELRSPGMCVN